MYQEAFKHCKAPKKIPHRCKLFLYIEGITEETGELERLIRCVDYMHSRNLKSVKQHTTGNDLLETLVFDVDKIQWNFDSSLPGGTC